MNPVPCPKCGRTLQQSGVLTVGNVELPTYQCDECIVPIDLGAGESIDGALTFCVDPDGNPFDPASPGGKLPI